MSEQDKDEAYESLVFECCFKLISHKGVRKPYSIPKGLDYLRDDELVVLAYLQQLSSERENAASVASMLTQAEPAMSEPEAHDSVQTVESIELEVPEPERLVEAPELVQLVEPETPDSVQTVETVEPEVPDIKLEQAIAPLPEPEVSGEGVTDTLDLDPLDPADIDSALTDELASEESDELIRIPTGVIPKTGLEASKFEPERLNLKNGRAGQPYQATIEGYSKMVLLDDGGTQLKLSAEGEVTVEQIAAGEYTLQIEAQKRGRKVKIRARLSIIADPRDLWKEIPSDQQAPRAKLDEDSSYRSTDKALIVAASKRGRSHAQEGKYRDDDFSIYADSVSGWNILVVADGAGSADLSREGSRIACKVAIDALPKLLVEKVDPRLQSLLANWLEPSDSWATTVREELLMPVLPAVALKAAKAIEDEATAMERMPQAFSTTIAIAVSKKIADKWFTASFTVGDGGVALFDAKKNQVVVMCRPDSGEYAGQTRFLACSEFDDEDDVSGRIFVDVRNDFTVLAAMTDGITDPKFPTDASFANSRVWSKFWNEDITNEVDFQSTSSEVEAQMLSWLDFWSRGNHDDRTIALMLPTGQGADFELESVPESAVADKLVEAQEIEQVEKNGSVQSVDSRQ